MREIEFRVWDKKNKYMFELDDDDFFINNHGLRKRCCVAYMGDAYVNVSDRYILMQYTGIKDKKGVKIFEGDVAEYENDYHQTKDADGNTMRYAVEYNDTSFKLDGIWLDTYPSEQLEVIGNIHENPELLEGK